MKVLITAMIVGLLSACATPAPRTTGPIPYETSEVAQPPSLFSGDAAVLSDSDIDRILKFSYTPPRQTRVAVLALGQSLWFSYSDELARSGEEVRSHFTSILRTSPAVTDAAYLPSLLIPSNRSVAYFREAAARYQADTLIVYQSSCRTYEKYRFFSSSTSKSFCNVEAAVLDVRTGIVPFTASATQEFVADQGNKDVSIYETMRKAELNATREALTKIGKEIVAFLAKT